MAASTFIASLLLLMGTGTALNVKEKMEVTPVEKVITLIEGLIKDSKDGGQSEAKTYEEFACFCKDQTMSKSESIEDKNDAINELSAAISSKTAEMEQMESAVQKAKAKLEALEAEKKSTEAFLAKKTTEYEAAAADLSKAISSLEGAIKTIEESKPTALFLPEIKTSIQQSLETADALNLVSEENQKAVAAFLQGPTAFLQGPGAYEFHSQGIIDILEKLLKDYQEKKAALDAEFEETKSSLTDKIAALTQQIEDTKNFINMGEEKIDQLSGEIADAREKLVQTDGLLKDDQLYLKDLTERCENKAKEFDQRSSQRGEELTALNKALGILTGTVAGVEGARALLQSNGTKAAEMAQDLLDAENLDKPPSLLQVQAVSLHLSENGMQQRKNAAVDFLGKEGRRLKSTVLLALVTKAAADPFAKVKGLIQKLLERLLSQAAAEATKKGFCDTELGKAEMDRDYRFSDVRQLNKEGEKLEVKLEELTAEIAELKEGIENLEAALSEARKLREEDKATNMKYIEDAAKGEKATSEALTILKEYYKSAAKATVLLQASPVDDDTSEASKGAYKGNQEAGGGIIAILEVILSDFQRTIKKTTAAENAAHEEFVKFKRAHVTDISGKSTAKKLDEQEAVKTKAAIENNMADLQTNMDQLDFALKSYEELVPTCVDTGMTYAERVAAREAEIEALHKALCILDGEGVEEDCKMG